MHYDEDDELLTDKFDYLAAPYEEEGEAELPAEYEAAPAPAGTRSNSLLLILLAGLALAALIAWLLCRRRHLKQGITSTGQDQLVMLTQNPDGSTRSQVLPAPMSNNNMTSSNPSVLPPPLARPPLPPPQSQPQPLPGPGPVNGAPAADLTSKQGKQNVVMQIPTLYAPFQSKKPVVIAPNNVPQQQQQQLPLDGSAPADGDRYGSSFDSRPRKSGEAPKKKFLPAQTSNMRTFVKAGERFRIPNSNRQHHAKVEKLLPNHKVRDPDSRLGKVHQEWLKKSKLPTRTDIKKAQSIREQEYFNSAPAAVPKFSMDHLRTKLQAPPPPKTPFNQPVNRS